MPHSLPSARHLSHFSAFYKTATFAKDGTATVTFMLPADQKPEILSLSENDGMTLNISVWETRMPDGEEALARALGMDLELGGD